MSISSELITLNTNMMNAYTACENKYATIPQAKNMGNLATCINSIQSIPPKKYQLLERILDDNNNEIGTVSGFFTDANDQEYAVVCLDAQYRLASGYYCDQSDYITNLPYYNRPTTSFWGNAKETATFNTQTILDWCTAQSAQSTACSHCRSKSFVIGGVTYYGQLPQIWEMIDICCNMSAINTADTSASSYPLLNFSSNRQFLTSTQCSSSYCWYFFDYAGIFYTSKQSNFFVVPVLELPNAL